MDSALYSYLCLARNHHGAALCRILTEAMGAAGVFTFGELLDMPNVVELSSSLEHKPWVDLLAIFCHGTTQDYNRTTPPLPPLTDAMSLKLKQLSIMTMAARKRTLAYSDLLAVLDITDVRVLEDLLIDCIALNLIDARIDQQHQQVAVLSCAARDIQPGDVGMMANTLREWAKMSNSLLAALKNVETHCVNEVDHRQKGKIAAQDKLKVLREEVKKEMADEDADGKGFSNPSQHLFGAVGSTPLDGEYVDEDEMDFEYGGFGRGAGSRKRRGLSSDF